MKTFYQICFALLLCVLFCNLGFAYDQEEAALKILKQAIKKHQKHRLEEALRDYKKVISLQPTWPEVYYNQGLAQNEFGDYEGAIQSFKQTLKLDPENDSAYFNRGIAHYELRNYRAAQKDFDKAIYYMPGDAKSYLNRAMVKQERGNLKGALQDARKAKKFFKELKNRSGQREAEDLIYSLKNPYESNY